MKQEPKERYQSISLEADDWRVRLSAESQVVSYEELYAFCVRCLSLNYRMAPELPSLLRLIDTANVKHVIYAALFGTQEATNGF